MEIKGGKCGEVESLRTLIFVSIRVLLLRLEYPAIEVGISNMATGQDSIFAWVVRFTLSQRKCSVKKMVGWSPEVAFLCG
jgi:hypothetical protein